MSESTGPIYEVTQSVDPELLSEFDAWLMRHVEEMLEIPGFVKAHVYAAEDDDRGWSRRVTHYYLESEADLEQYLAGTADIMRQSAIDAFGERCEASRRTLRNASAIDGSLQPLEACLNCGTTLSGQYCGNCGQRSRSRLISIWELVRDAFGDLLELDSRVWRTLIPLVTKPGKLTRDYLEGRRVRYMPPFRTYLVLSIFFFVVAFFDPRHELGILFSPEPDTTTSGATEEQTEAIRDQVAQELVDDGLIDEENLDSQDESDDEKDDDQLTVSIDGNEVDRDCDIEDFEDSEVPLWLASRLSKERLQAVCKRIVADDGRAFLDKLLDNVPAALFILLPLMAFVLKVLYPLSKRYYVEHLLFVLHFHAFFFLLLILQVLFVRLADTLSFPDNLAGILVFAVSFYIPVYLYKSMRRVYEQGHLVTIPKYIVLLTAYFTGFSFIFLFAAVFAAFSI